MLENSDKTACHAVWLCLILSGLAGCQPTEKTPNSEEAIPALQGKTVDSTSRSKTDNTSPAVKENKTNPPTVRDLSKAQSYFERATELFEREKYAESIPLYTECLRYLSRVDREQRWSAYGLRGIAFYKTGDYEQSISDSTEALSAAVDLAPPDIIARMYYQRGMAYLAQNKSEKHKADFESAYRYDPTRKHEPQYDEE